MWKAAEVNLLQSYSVLGRQSGVALKHIHYYQVDQIWDGVEVFVLPRETRRSQVHVLLPSLTFTGIHRQAVCRAVDGSLCDVYLNRSCSERIWNLNEREWHRDDPNPNPNPVNWLRPLTAVV